MNVYAKKTIALYTHFALFSIVAIIIFGRCGKPLPIIAIVEMADDNHQVYMARLLAVFTEAVEGIAGQSQVIVRHLRLSKQVS